MFNLEEFLRLGKSEQERRSARVQIELRNPDVREAVRQAAKAIPRLNNPYEDQTENGVRELNAFATRLGTASRTDLNTFRRFVAGITKAPRALDLTIVLLFLLDAARRHAGNDQIVRLVFGSDDVRRPLFAAISEFITSGDEQTLQPVSAVRTGNPGRTPLSGFDLASAFPIMLDVLQRSNPLEDEVWRRFSPDYVPSAKRASNALYFLCYRHSTVQGGIIRGFFVIKRHPRTNIGRFRFSQFLWGGAENPNIFREAHGVMLAVEKAYYFLGYGVSVPVSKRDGHFRRTREYRLFREKPQVKTVELAAIEYEDLELQDVILSGLTMTSAGHNQPVLGRMAWLCLGTDRDFQKEMFDDHVVPTEVTGDALEQDLLATLNRLAELGFTNFDRRLGFKKGTKQFDAATIQLCATRIRHVIDNTPHWERSGDNPNRKPGQRSAGAIESEARGRPRT